MDEPFQSSNRYPSAKAKATFGQQIADEAAAILESEPDAAKLVSERQLKAAERISDLSVAAGLSQVRGQIEDLAAEYVGLRTTMSSGSQRTQRMEVVATKMRTLSLALTPLLPDLIQSESPGERLAAVTALQVNPHAEYLTWLGRRVCEEKPFVGYHAAVALAVAARTFGQSHRKALTEAIDTAKECLGPDRTDTDRWKSLTEAERALDEKD